MHLMNRIAEATDPVELLDIMSEMYDEQKEILQKQDSWLSGLNEMLNKRDAVIVELARRSPEKIEGFLKLNLSIQELDEYFIELFEPVGRC